MGANFFVKGANFFLRLHFDLLRDEIDAFEIKKTIIFPYKALSGLMHISYYYVLFETKEPILLILKLNIFYDQN